MRTFIAVGISSALRRRAASAIESMAATTSSMRWVPLDNIHVTVKFLGDVDESDLYRVCRATNKAVQDRAPFRVYCRALGAFPSIDRPRTVWLGVDDAEQQMAKVFESVEQELLALGFPQESRRFHPHLTLGRLRYGRRNIAELVECLHRQAAFDGGPIDVRELLVYSSEPTREGPVYTVMGRAPLAG